MEANFSFIKDKSQPGECSSFVLAGRLPTLGPLPTLERLTFSSTGVTRCLGSSANERGNYITHDKGTEENSDCFKRKLCQVYTVYYFSNDSQISH